MKPVKKRIHSCFDKSKEQVYEKFYQIGLDHSPLLIKSYSLQSHVWVRVMGSVRSHLEGKLFDAAR
jgi:hypothetical protein